MDTTAARVARSLAPLAHFAEMSNDRVFVCESIRTITAFDMLRYKRNAGVSETGTVVHRRLTVNALHAACIQAMYSDETLSATNVFV